MKGALYMNVIVKKLIISIVVLAFIPMNISMQTYAQGNVTISNESEIVISIREDVPASVACKDRTYNKFIAKKDSNQNSIMANNENVRWDIAGNRLFNNLDHLIAAHGYSAHMKDDTVLDTYHYTRVYFGRSKAGDSDRIWGKGMVYATGPWTDWEVASNSTLYVKYGTESK